MNQKNIDRLFQENLKNLDKKPSKRVWNTIEYKLKKKKRSVIPFWWLTGGIAAVFLLGVLLYPFNSNKNSLDKIDTKIIITDSSKKEKDDKTSNKNHIDSIIQKKNTLQKVLVADDVESEKTIKKQRKIIHNSKDKKELVSTKNAMEKIFLADNFIKKKIDSSKTKAVEFNEKKNHTFTKTDKREIRVVEKNGTPKKLDIHNFLKEKDSIILPKTLKNKWSIAPVFAVLNSNSFSNTSPIDNNLTNSTKGKSTFSYGLQVSYKINKKWTIQTGVHLQEISFTNKNVSAISSIFKSTSSVSYNNGGSFSFGSNLSQSSDITSTSFVNESSLTGDLNQNYGYMEIPIEIKYNFLNKKTFNSQIVAGFSSLFLNKNEVSLTTQFLSNSGKATHLNTINFSGNLGLDFNYLLNKNWSLNLNPMFKAQLNTFSENSNGFSPFFIGIYSGIKYQF